MLKKMASPTLLALLFTWKTILAGQEMGSGTEKAENLDLANEKSGADAGKGMSKRAVSKMKAGSVVQD